MQYVLGRDITRDLRRGQPLPAPLPGGHDHLPAALRRRTGPLGLLDVNWLTPEKRRELDRDRRGRDAAAPPTSPRTSGSPSRARRRPAGTSSPACAATARAPRCGSRCARSSRCGPSSRPSPLRPRRHARAGQRPRRLPGAGRRPRRARLGRQLRVRSTLLDMPSPARSRRRLEDRPHDPLRHPRLQRGREHPPPAGRPRRRAARELGARVIIVDDGSTDGTAEVDRGAPPRTCTWRSSAHQVNRGLGTAINSGLRAALGESSDDDAIVTLEADNTSDLDDLPRMLERFDAGHRHRARLGLRAGRPDRRRRAVAAGRLQGGLEHLPLRRRAAGDPHAVARCTASTAPARCAARPRPTATCWCASPASPPTSSCCSSSTTPAPRSPRCRRSTTGAGALGVSKMNLQADRARLRTADGRAPRRPHPAAADLAARASTPVAAGTRAVGSREVDVRPGHASPSSAAASSAPSLALRLAAGGRATSRCSSAARRSAAWPAPWTSAATASIASTT